MSALGESGISRTNTNFQSAKPCATSKQKVQLFTSTPTPLHQPRQGPCWRNLALAAAVVAAAVLALSAPAAAQNIPPAMLPFGRIDCLKPTINLEGFNLNKATHQITPLPISATKARRRLQGASGEEEEDVTVNAYDASEHPMFLVAPYWRKLQANGKPQKAPAKIARATASDALAASEKIGAVVESTITTERAVNASRLASSRGVSVASVAVTPTTVTIADLFSITYYGTWKRLTNLVTNEVYILYQCGTPKPSVPAGARAFEIPLRSVSVPDTTALAFMVRGWGRWWRVLVVRVRSQAEGMRISDY